MYRWSKPASKSKRSRPASDICCGKSSRTKISVMTSVLVLEELLAQNSRTPRMDKEIKLMPTIGVCNKSVGSNRD